MSFHLDLPILGDHHIHGFLAYFTLAATLLTIINIIALLINR
jgi:hypothetical protein